MSIKFERIELFVVTEQDPEHPNKKRFTFIDPGTNQVIVEVDNFGHDKNQFPRTTDWKLVDMVGRP
jgi:hypothetical protein